MVEIRFPWDDPIGVIYRFNVTDETQINGYRKSLTSENELLDEELLSVKEVEKVLHAFRDFDWNNPEDEDDPEVYKMTPDDFLVTIQATTVYSERVLEISFSTSEGVQNLLRRINLISQ